MAKIKCGRCSSEWNPEDFNQSTGEFVSNMNNRIKCPVCGYNKSEIQESKDSRKVLKG